jgi:hypothetical protein
MPKFPASREFAGNFIEAGLGGASTAAKKGFKPEPYEPIPYASEQGIFGGLAGNSKWRTGKFSTPSREIRSGLNSLTVRDGALTFFGD